MRNNVMAIISMVTANVRTARVGSLRTEPYAEQPESNAERWHIDRCMHTGSLKAVKIAHW